MSTVAKISPARGLLAALVLAAAAGAATAEPRGKIRDFAPLGYIGLQNHDWETSVHFRNIRVKPVD